MSHFWPTSVEAVNTASWIAILGGIALALLAVVYVLDWFQDRMHRRVERVNAEALEQLHGDMAQRRAQAKVELVNRTVTHAAELRTYSSRPRQ